MSALLHLRLLFLFISLYINICIQVLFTQPHIKSDIVIYIVPLTIMYMITSVNKNLKKNLNVENIIIDTGIYCNVLYFVVLVTGQDFCDSFLIGNLREGIITSPNFPFDYPTQRNCRHRIHLSHQPSNSNRTICFTFRRFQVLILCLCYLY